VDADNDGVTADDDCDDNDASVGAPGDWWSDADGDSHGEHRSASIQACEAPADHAANDGDCDDTEETVYPGAEEICDGLDNDCDLQIDADDDDFTGTVETWYPDVDEDTYGDGSVVGLDACADPSEDDAPYVLDHTDCDDTLNHVNPGELEVCADGLDNDCNGDTTECRLEGIQATEGALAALDLPEDWVSNVAAHDVDNDGNPELLVAFRSSDQATTNGGGIWVLEDPTSGTAVFDVAPTWSPSSNYEEMGTALDVGGDFDGDGTPDLVFGAPGADEGAAYLVLGGTALTTGTADTTATAGWTGTVTYADCGGGVAFVGDLNGDGYDELALSETSKNSGAGGVALLYGNGGPNGQTSLVDGDHIYLAGEGSYDRFGGSTRVAGADLNGDGNSDLVVGEIYDSVGGSQTGSVWIWYGSTLGPATGTTSESADASVVGDSAGDRLGATVRSAGDVDDDGYDDVWIVATGNEDYASEGVAYLLPGQSADLGSETLAAAVVSVTLTHTGGDPYDVMYGGLRVGDLDGDGNNDVVAQRYEYAVAAPPPLATDSTAGTYVFYGPLSGTLDADSDADASYRSDSISTFAVGDVDGWLGDELLVADDTLDQILIFSSSQ
jgi:hypothetical protein